MYCLISSELYWFETKRNSYGKREFNVFQKTITIYLFYKKIIIIMAVLIIYYTEGNNRLIRVSLRLLYKTRTSVALIMYYLYHFVGYANHKNDGAAWSLVGNIGDVTYAAGVAPSWPLAFSTLMSPCHIHTPYIMITSLFCLFLIAKAYLLKVNCVMTFSFVIF